MSHWPVSGISGWYR